MNSICEILFNLEHLCPQHIGGDHRVSHFVEFWWRKVERRLKRRGKGNGRQRWAIYTELGILEVLQPWWDCMESFQDLLFLPSAPMGSLCTVIQNSRMKDKMTNNDRYRSCSQMGKGDERGKKGLTISAFLYLGSLFVVCFVRVLLMLVFKMCSVSPADAAGWENRSLLQRQNTTFVLEWVEESIRVPCEKFPECVTEEVCLICVLKYVRMLQYIQTSTRGAQTNTDRKCTSNTHCYVPTWVQIQHCSVKAHPKLSQAPDHFLNEWLMCFHCVWESEQRHLTSDASFRSDKVWTRMS